MILDQRLSDLERRLNEHIDGHEDLRDEVTLLAEQVEAVRIKLGMSESLPEYLTGPDVDQAKAEMEIVRTDNLQKQINDLDVRIQVLEAQIAAALIDISKCLKLAGIPRS